MGTRMLGQLVETRPLQKEVETVDQQETAAKRGNASGSSGSEQEVLERPLHTAHSVQVRCAAENSVGLSGKSSQCGEGHMSADK